MRKKLLILLLSIISTVCLAAGLAACDSESGANEGSTSESNYSSSQGSSSDDGDGNEADSWYDGVYTINTAYAAATDLGYSGTLDEFIASISGTNGTDGVSVTAIVINTKGELVITLSSGGDVNLGKITGDDGEDGSVWYTGAGAPSADTGKDCDMYLDTSSYDIYAKADGAWAKTGNIKGDDGSKGDTGVGITSIEINEKGELVITLTDNSHYEIALPTTETTEYTLTYEENDSGYTVTGVSSKDVTSVEIPATYNEKAVTAIGSKAFANCIYLEEVTIPDSVTTIGNYAFYNCSMLESIVLPEGVTSMGKGVLYGCNLLESLTFSFNYDTTTETGFISYLFGSSNYLNNSTSVPILLTTITLTGTTIPNYALENCENIENVILESNITSIGTMAFNSCSSLNNIIAKGSITKCGTNAFTETEYYNDTNNWEDGVLYIGNCLVATQASYYMSSYISGSYTVKDGTTAIAGYAFRGEEQLTEITIPSTVKSIGEYAFESCKLLVKVSISKGVENIGEGAFIECSALEEINLPSSITSIGNSAFNNCTALKEIVIPDTITSLSESIFYECTALTSINIPNGIKTIGAYAFYNCSNLTKITIPNSVTDIDEYAFYGCSAAASITLGTGVVSIGRNAFANCATITEITIPDNVVYLGIQAFYGCTNLSSITISKNIKLIGSNAFTDTAFYNDESNYIDGVLYIDTYLLRAKTTISGSYTVKAGTTVIASRAFEDCTGLTSVTIASSVTIVGGSVFNRCTALTEVTFSNSDNWYRTTENTFIDGTSTDLSDASTNATYFTETYYKLYWYQLETTTD